MTDYKKMVLLEAAELDRIRQRQIREYDPNVSAMAKAQAQIDDILLNEKLSDAEKFALMNHAQNRYEAIKAKIGPISTTKQNIAEQPPANSAAGVIDQQQQQGQVLSNVTSSSTMQDLDEVSKDLDPSLIPDYHMLKSLIAQNPNLFKTNRTGELVVKKKTMKGTNLNDILKSLLTGEKVDTTPGVSDFIKGIRSINVPKKAFSSTRLINLLFPKSPSVTTFSLKSTRKRSPSDLGFASRIPAAPPPSPTFSPRYSIKSTSSKSKSQKGKGLPHPPGKRPRILWLYQ